MRKIKKMTNKQLISHLKYMRKRIDVLIEECERREWYNPKLYKKLNKISKEV